MTGFCQHSCVSRVWQGVIANPQWAATKSTEHWSLDHQNMLRQVELKSWELAVTLTIQRMLTSRLRALVKTDDEGSLMSSSFLRRLWKSHLFPYLSVPCSHVWNAFECCFRKPTQNPTKAVFSFQPSRMWKKYNSQDCKKERMAWVTPYSTSCKMAFNSPLSYFDMLLLTATTEQKY